MESVQLKLSNLDKKTNALVQEGKYLEAIDVMEEALGIRKDFFGETSDEYYKTAEKLCEHYNMLSMIFLSKEKFDSTYEFLKKGEALAFSSLDLKAVTYNNLACYYRRIGKLRIALKYLEDAINIEIRLEKTKTLADTYLNICAVHSQLGRHDIAMNYVMKSILLLQDELLGYSLGTDDGETPLVHQAKVDKKDKKKQFDDRVAILTIAYHNLGVEYEHMKQYGEAVATYKKAVKIGKRYLDDDNLMIKNLENIIEVASQQLEDAKDKSKQKTKGQLVYGKQYSLSSTKSKPASNVPSKEGSRTDAAGPAPKQEQGQGHLYGELEAQYKANTKPITKEKKLSQPLSGELVSASSGFASHINKPEGGNIAKIDEMVNPSSHYSEDQSGENPGKSSRDSKVEVSH